MSATLTPTRIPYAELILLFRGDDSSMGYAHEEIVCSICSRFQGDRHRLDADVIRNIIYPMVSWEDVGADVKIIIERGIDLWKKRGSRSS